MPIARINRQRTALLVVDFQPSLLPLIDDQERVTQMAVKLIHGCTVLGVPMMATVQNPSKLGDTVEPIVASLPEGTRVEPKLKFSACVESVRAWLGATGCSTVLVCGIESHICVTQTVLDVLSMGLVAAVVGDAIGARRKLDHDLAITRMHDAGALIVSVEMALTEMAHEAGTGLFKALLPVLKM